MKRKKGVKNSYKLIEISEMFGEIDVNLNDLS